MTMPNDIRQSRIDTLLARAEELAARDYGATKDDWLNNIRPRFIKRLEHKPLSSAELDEDRWSEKAIQEVLDPIIDEIIADARLKKEPPQSSIIHDSPIDQDFQRAVLKEAGVDLDGQSKGHRGRKPQK